MPCVGAKGFPRPRDDGGCGPREGLTVCLAGDCEACMGKSERDRPRVPWLVDVFNMWGQYTDNYPLKEDNRKLVVAEKAVEA